MTRVPSRKIRHQLDFQLRQSKSYEKMEMTFRIDNSADHALRCALHQRCWSLKGRSQEVKESQQNTTGNPPAVPGKCFPGLAVESAL